MKGNSVSFPDDSDNLTLFAGQTTRIVLPNKLLELALKNLSYGMYFAIYNCINQILLHRYHCNSCCKFGV